MKLAFLAIALVVFVGVLALPTPEGLTEAGHRTLAVFILTVILWVLGPVSFAITFFLIVALLVVLGVLTPDSAFQGFGVSTIFFLMGAFILASAITKHGLHKRIALKILSNPHGALNSFVIIGRLNVERVWRPGPKESHALPSL